MEISFSQLLDIVDGGSPEERLALAQKLAPNFLPGFQEPLRSGNMEDVRQNFWPRVTVNDVDVKNNSAGVAVWGGPSRFAVMDFPGATGWIDANDGNTVHIRTAGGGADCMFDYLSSGCFATQTLFTFTEGMTFTTASGCTFKGYSTIQGSITAMAALGVGVNAVLFICGGTYNEQVTGTPNISSNWDIYGAGSGRVNWAATGAGQTMFSIGTTSSGSRITISGIHFNLGAFGTCVGLTSANNWIGNASRCHFTTGDSTSIGAATINALGGTYDDCTFSGAGIGYKALSSVAQLTNFTGCYFGSATGMHLNGNRIQINGCIFNCATKDIVLGVNCFEINISGGNEFNTGISTTGGGQLDNFTFIGNTMRLGAAAIGLDFSSITVNSNGFMIAGNSFYGTGGAIGIKLDANMITGMIGPNTFKGFTTGNEISGTGGGITGAHNVSDAGAIADFGLPVGHAGLAGGAPGTGSGANAGEPFVTVGNTAGLSAERALTAGTGITVTDNGANSTVVIASTEPDAAAHIADTSDAHDASAISILDTANDFTATDVEGALAELQSDNEAHVTASANGKIRAIIFNFHGGGSALATQLHPSFMVPFACTIDRWSIQGDAAGTCTIDVQTATDSAAPSYASIVGGGTKPNVAGPAVGAVSTVPASWTSTAITARTLIQANLSAVATFKWLTLTLEVTEA